jgi:transcriptional regulator with XRE-family HTH domain
MALTLKAARVNRGLTQTEAARLIGISKTTLCKWENYQTYPTVEHLPAIEKAYDVKYDDIIFLPTNSALSVTNG